MKSQRLPALLLSMTASAFMVWAVVLVLSPAGSVALEWIILGVSAGLLTFGVVSLRSSDPQRVGLIRWLLTAFAVFGAVVVIGLGADDTSSRTWARLGWAALAAGFLTSLAAWWAAPRINRRIVFAGGVVGLVVIAGGVGITVNCDKALQRPWCDPVYEQEEVLAARIAVDGTLQRSGRAGGDTGAALRAYLIEGTAIRPVTEGLSTRNAPFNRSRWRGGATRPCRGRTRIVRSMSRSRRSRQATWRHSPCSAGAPGSRAHSSVGVVVLGLMVVIMIMGRHLRPDLVHVEPLHL